MQPDAPLFSVIIVSWNGRELLAGSLRALSEQSCRRFETIVVDNGSTDGSAEWLKKEHPDVQLVALETNTGFAAGNNAGYARSRGKIIVTLNNDMAPRPDWLEKLTAGFEKDARVGICVGKVLFADRPSVINSAGDVLFLDGQGGNRGIDEEDRGQFDGEGYVSAASAGAAAYRREMLEEIGFFDEDYFAYFEDVDLSLRALRRGWRCLYIPTAVAYHRHMGTTRRRGEEFWMFHSTRNKFWNIVKDFPDALLLPALAHSLQGSLLFALRHRKSQGVMRSVAAGVLEAVKGFGRARRKRIPAKVGALQMVRAIRGQLDG